MNEDQAVIYLICGGMFLRALTNKNMFSFDLYKNCLIQNKFLKVIEKSLMMILPMLVVMANALFQIHSIVIRVWLILIVLLDFAIQYLAKSCGWVSIAKQTKISSSLFVWLIFMVAIFFTIK